MAVSSHAAGQGPAVRRSARITAATAGIVSAISAVVLCNHFAGAATNSEYDVVSGSSDLTASGTYSTGGIPGTGTGGTAVANPPSVATDVTFDIGVPYSPTAFTLNSSQTFGSLNDLSTLPLAVDNATGTGDSLTLGGAGDLGDSVPKSDPADLVFVAAGGTLNIGSASSAPLGLVLGQSGNFDISGTSTIGSAISDNGSGFGITKTGGGVLTLSTAETYSGITNVNVGGLTLTGTIGTGVNVLGLGGGTFNYAAPGVAGIQTFATTNINPGGSAINNTVAGNTLALGNLSRSVGGTIDFAANVGPITTATTTNSGGIMGGYATYGGLTTWAVAPGSSGGAITGLYAGSYVQSSVVGTTSANYAGNIDSNSSPVLDGPITVNSARFNTLPATTLTLTGVNVLSTGGVLVTPLTANGTFSGGAPSVVSATLTGGTIEAGSGNEVLFNIAPGKTLTLNSVVADNGSPTSLTVSGGGTLNVTANPTYTGPININNATVSINSGAAADSAVFGSPSTTVANQITADGGTILSENAANAISASQGITVLAGGLTFNQVAGKTLSVNSTITGAGPVNVLAGNTTLTLAGSNTFTGGLTISENTIVPGGATVLTGGTVVLSGANSFGNGPVTLEGGKLSLSGSLSTNAPLALAGGTLAFAATSPAAQSFIATSLVGSNSPVSAVASDTLNLGNFSRSVGGGAIDVTTTAGSVTTTSPNTGTSILGGWATTNTEANWAVSGGSVGTPAAITPLASYTAFSTATNTFAPGTSADVDFQVSNTTGALTQTINSLRYNTGAQVLTIAAGNVLTVATGGILVTPSSTNGTISGGSITAGAGNELIDVGTKNLTIGSAITNNPNPVAVTLDSPGTLTLSGVNTYSGGTFINEGVVALGSSASAAGTGKLYLGAVGSALTAAMSTGASTNYATAITVEPGGERFIFTSSAPTPTFSGAIVLAGGASLAIGPNGGSTVTVTGGVTGTGNLALGCPQAGRSGGTNISTGAINMVGFLADSVKVSLGYGAENTGTALINCQIGSNVTALLQDSPTNTFALTAANNPFYGDSLVTAGTLNLRNATTLQNSVVYMLGGALSFGTSTTGISAVTLGGLAGTGNVGLSNTLSTPGSVALTVGNSNILNGNSVNENTLNPVYSGVLSNGTSALAASVTKIGSNTQTFSGANTYTGGTTISGGTLAAGVASIYSGSTQISGAFGVNSAVNLANTAGASLNLQTFSNQIGSLTGGGTVVVGSGAVLTIGGSAITASYAGVISGTGGFSMSATGASTQTLTGLNTYSGATTINSGTLAISGTGQLLNDTAITVGSSGTFAAKPGSGAVSIGASNASLNLNPGANFSMHDGAIGTATINGVAATNVVTFGGTTGAGSATNLTFDLSTTGAADELIIPNGNIAYAGSPVNDISLVKVGTGSTSTLHNIPLIYAPNSSNGIIPTDFTIPNGAISLNGVLYTASLSTESGPTTPGDYLYLNLTATAAASSYFKGSGGNGSWATPNNFATDHTGTTLQSAVPTGANVVLTADSATNFALETLDASYGINSLTFTGTNTSAAGQAIGVYAGTGGFLTLNAVGSFNVTSGASSPVTSSYAAGIGLVVQAGSGSNIINAPILLGSSQTWENDSAAGALAVNGNITDGGLSCSLTKTGVGTLVLGGTNTYSGGTFVAAGTLQLASGAASALPASGTLTVNGGTFDLNGNSESIAALSDGGVTTGTITSSAGTPTLTLNGASPVGFGGAVKGSLSLTLSGGATVTLSGANTYTGLTSVSSGTIVAASNSALGSSSAVSAGLLLSGSATANFTSPSPVIASLTGAAANSVVLGNSATSSATALSVGGNGATTTFAGIISDLHATNPAAFGSLNVAGGTLVLTNTNTYTGTTSIAPGATLQLGSGGATGALAGAGGAITDNGTLVLTRTGTFNQGTDFSANPIGGTGAIVSNQGQVNLNEPNTYSGGTFVNAGVLFLGGSAAAYTLYPTDAGTGTITLGVNGSATSAAVVSGGIVTVNQIPPTVNFANPFTINPGGNRSFYTANTPDVTYSGLFTLVGGAILGFGVNGSSPYVALTGGIVGTGNVEIGCPLIGRAANINVSGGTVNMVGALSDYITYGNQLSAGSYVNISSTLGSNVTALLQNATNATMTISGSSPAFIGDTTVSTGTLNIQSSGALQASVLNLNGGAVTFGQALTTSPPATFPVAIVDVGATAVGGLSGSVNLNLINLGAAGGGVNLTIGNSNLTNGSGSNPNTLNPTYSGSISNSTGTSSLTKVGSNVQTLSGSNTYNGGTFVSAGELVLASASAFPGNTSLNVSGGSLAQLANHGGGSTYVPVVSLLSNNGTIDLTNNALVIHNLHTSSGNVNGPAAAAVIFTQIQNAYNNGAWNGTNSSSGVITSTQAANDSTHLTAVGYVTGASGSFENVSGGVTSSDVLVKYTYYGDATLDGTVDGSDYSRIDNGYLAGASGWFNGDFNYDGQIDGSDYTLIDNAFNTQGANIASEIANPSAVATAQIAGTSAVPEPTTLGVLGLGAIGLLGRRRRRN